MAEQIGKIAEFDWAVMERVFKIFRQAGPDMPFPVAVNISGLSISTPEYVNSLTSIIKLNLDLTEFILFEVTESSKITDLQGPTKP